MLKFVVVLTVQVYVDAGERRVPRLRHGEVLEGNRDRSCPNISRYNLLVHSSSRVIEQITDELTI